MPKNLLEACDPLFQYICRLNRMARKGASIDYATARAEITQTFDQISAGTRGDVGLSEQFKKVELVLVFFVDSMISESTLPFAGDWNNNRLAYDHQELSGDEKFFDLLDVELRDTREGSSERLAIYYTCLGLGFTGCFAGQSEFLRKKMLELFPRVKTYVDNDDSALISPDAYQHTNTLNLPLPVGSGLIPLLIIFFGLIALVLAVNIVTFQGRSKELGDTLERVIAKDPASVKSTP